MHTENVNYPYSYLHNVGNGIFQLLVIVASEPRYKISPITYNLKDSIWCIAFDEVQPGSGVLPEPYYSIRMNVNDSVQITTLPIGSSESRTSAQNACKIHTGDSPTSGGQFPQDKKYLPHLYATRKTENLTICSMYVAIHTSNRNPFKIEKPIEEGINRIINITEQSTGDWNKSIWTEKWLDYDIPLNEGSTIVQVFDNKNSAVPVAKGTIRHSAADNKPFDLLRCEDFEG